MFCSTKKKEQIIFKNVLGCLLLYENYLKKCVVAQKNSQTPISNLFYQHLFSVIISCWFWYGKFGIKQLDKCTFSRKKVMENSTVNTVQSYL